LLHECREVRLFARCLTCLDRKVSINRDTCLSTPLTLSIHPTHSVYPPHSVCLQRCVWFCAGVCVGESHGVLVRVSGFLCSTCIASPWVSLWVWVWVRVSRCDHCLLVCCGSCIFVGCECLGVPVASLSLWVLV